VNEVDSLGIESFRSSPEGKPTTSCWTRSEKLRSSVTGMHEEADDATGFTYKERKARGEQLKLVDERLETAFLKSAWGRRKAHYKGKSGKTMAKPTERKEG